MKFSPVFFLIALVFVSCDSGPKGEKLQFADLDFPITFEQRADQYKGVEVPAEVTQKWNKKAVQISGYMLPISAEKKVTEFMLVKSLWTCCYGQPPDINQVIYVKSKDPVEYYQEPIQIEGNFTAAIDYGSDGSLRSLYQVEANRVRVMKQ